jgi:hypothetical protein
MNLKKINESLDNLKLILAEDIGHDILKWLGAAKKSVEDHSKKEYPDEKRAFLRETLGWDKGPKFYKVWHTPIDGKGGKSAYCFIDMEGNIYKAAGWNAPAKGIRGTIKTVDPTKLTYRTDWLYR